MTEISQRQINEFDEFAKDVLFNFQNEDILKLGFYYTQLSEECDARGKLYCLSLKEYCSGHILLVITDCNKQKKLKYFAWHYLQLMTIEPSLRVLLKENLTLLRPLLDLHSKEWTDLEKSSLNLVSLNFIVSMLGEGEDCYYDHVADCGFIEWLHERLNQCCLSGADTNIELILLIINLILEGTDSCKRQLNNFKFSSLLSRKIQSRENCHVELLKIANLTFQKLLLLTSDQQTFVETFRKDFTSEFKKKPEEFQKNRCFSNKCESKEILTYKQCSKCHIATYCSKECQVIHWKEEHSKLCGT